MALVGEMQYLTIGNNTYSLPHGAEPGNTVTEVGTSTASGSSTAFSREDHVHKLTAAAGTAVGLASTGYVTGLPISTFTNDKGYITQGQIPPGAAAYDGPMSKVGQTTAAGSSNAFARGDHVHSIVPSDFGLATTADLNNYVPVKSTYVDYFSSTATIKNPDDEYGNTILLRVNAEEDENNYQSELSINRYGASLYGRESSSLKSAQIGITPDILNGYISITNEHGNEANGFYLDSQGTTAILPIVVETTSSEPMALVTNSQLSASGLQNLIDGSGSSALHQVSNYAQGAYSVALGYQTTATTNYSYAEGGNTLSSGNYSHAQGYKTTANGNSAHAEGSQTYAKDAYSHTEGSQTRAENGSHAEGNKTTASGGCSHAEGWLTIASGGQSHAQGRETSATTSYAHAQGYETCATSIASHAEGCNTVTIGNYAHAEGYYTYAASTAAHAEGYNTTASGRGSHAGGYYTIANTTAQTAIGKYNIISTTTADAFIIGNGTGINNRSNAFTVAWNGNTTVAGLVTLGATGTGNSAVSYAQMMDAIPSISVSATTAEIYQMNTAGSVTAGSAASFTQGTDSFTKNKPTVIDTTKFSGGSFTRGSFSGGSFTQGSDSHTSFNISFTIDSANQNLTIGTTAGTFTQGTDSYTAATHGDDSFTPAAIASGFYTAGTSASFTQGVDTFTANTPTSVTLPTRSATTVVTSVSTS